MVKRVLTGTPPSEYSAFGESRKSNEGSISTWTSTQGAAGNRIQEAARSSTANRLSRCRPVSANSEFVGQPASTRRVIDTVSSSAAVVSGQLPEVLTDPADWAGAIHEVDAPTEVSALLPARLPRSDGSVSRDTGMKRKEGKEALKWTETDQDRRDKVAGRWATGVVVKIFAGFGLLAGAIAGFLLGGPMGAITGASSGFLLIGGLAATIGYIAGYCYATATINDEKKALVAEMEQTLSSLAAPGSVADSEDVALEFPSEATSSASRNAKLSPARRSAEPEDENGETSVKARRRMTSKTSKRGSGKFPSLPRRQSTFIGHKSLLLAGLSN